MNASSIARLTLVLALIDYLVMLLISRLLKNNDPPRRGIGLRTPRMLADPELRRRAEVKLSKNFQIYGAVIGIVIVICVIIANIWLSLAVDIASTVVIVWISLKAAA